MMQSGFLHAETPVVVPLTLADELITVNKLHGYSAFTLELKALKVAGLSLGRYLGSVSCARTLPQGLRLPAPRPCPPKSKNYRKSS